MWVENYVRGRRLYDEVLATLSVNLSLECSCDIAYLLYHSNSPIHLCTLCRHRVNIILSIIQGTVSSECNCDKEIFIFYKVCYTCFVNTLRRWTICVTGHFGHIHYSSAIILEQNRFQNIRLRCHPLILFSNYRTVDSSKTSSLQSALYCSRLKFLLFFVFPLRSSSSCLPILPRLSVTSILPSIFPSLTCFRRQFLRKLWPILSAFLLFIVCRIFLSCLALCNTYSFFTLSVHLIYSILL